MLPKSYREFAASIIRALDGLDMLYAIGGSFASSLYGEARTTADIDISIVLPLTDIQRFVTAMQAAGYYAVFDDVLVALTHGQPFNVIDPESGFKADMFIVQPTPLETSILQRRRKVVYDPQTLQTASLYSPEDVIVYKLKYYLMGQSQKHLRDIAAILVVQGDSLDYGYITGWADQLDAVDVWNGLLAEYRQRLT
ncbi:MAG: hypothetical protein KIS91_11830 [Anaerolineae bacterium]|nr:hypothetical protein [Anaerolineae bacterium]